MLECPEIFYLRFQITNTHTHTHTHTKRVVAVGATVLVIEFRNATENLIVIHFTKSWVLLSIYYLNDGL